MSFTCGLIFGIVFTDLFFEILRIITLVSKKVS
nr:MAG TPA: hypothetical protein [Caudoviricetes sp.]